MDDLPLGVEAAWPFYVPASVLGPRPKPLIDPFGESIGSRLLVDPLLAALLFVPLLPLLALIAFAIILEGKGPVLYSQERVGFRGRPFRVWKFRTMYTDAEKDGPVICKNYKDERITPLGYFLRKTKLDELPQLWNVVRGEMSLVGPRPERPVFHEKNAQEVSRWTERIAVRPGITGLAQISKTVSHDPVEKIELDLEYIENRSFWLDVGILYATMAIVIRLRQF